MTKGYNSRKDCGIERDLRLIRERKPLNVLISCISDWRKDK